jgi:hypothetical protein
MSSLPSVARLSLDREERKRNSWRAKRVFPLSDRRPNRSGEPELAASLEP